MGLASEQNFWTALLQVLAGWRLPRQPGAWVVRLRSPFPPTPHSLLCAAGIRRRRMEEKHFLELVLCWIKICIFIYRIVYIHFWPTLHVYKFIIKALARCPWRIRTSWGGRPATCVVTPCCQGCMRPWRIGAREVASPLLTLFHLWTRGLLLFFPEFTSLAQFGCHQKWSGYKWHWWSQLPTDDFAGRGKTGWRLQENSVHYMGRKEQIREASGQNIQFTVKLKLSGNILDSSEVYLDFVLP